MASLKKNLIGVLLSMGLAGTAWLLAPRLPVAEAVTVALVLGIFVGNLAPLGKRASPGIRFCERTVLAWAIALMGLKLQLAQVLALGPGVLLIVAPMMAASLALALALGRLFGYPRSFSILLGTGNAVCGSSAIAAVAPGARASESEIGISIGVINLLGAIGMLVLPLLASRLAMSDSGSAYLIGGGLQAVGQVVGAGFSMGEAVGAAATLVKMLRILMLVPLVLIVPLLSGHRGEKGGVSAKMVPPYLVGFVAFSIAATLLDDRTPNLLDALRQVARIALMIAMAAIGMRIRFADLVRQAPKALAAGGLIAIAQVGFLLLAIRIAGKW